MPAWGRMWFRAGRLKKDPTLLLRSLRITHRLQNATPWCDSSLWCIAFFSLPFSSPHTLTGILSLPCFSLDRTSFSYRRSTFTHCVTPSQLISITTLFWCDSKWLGDAGKRPLSGLRCIDLNTANTHSSLCKCLCREAIVYTHTQTHTQRDPSINIDWHLPNHRHSLSHTHAQSHAGRKNFKLQVWVTRWLNDHAVTHSW